LARAIDDERKGLPTITVIEEGDTSNKVWAVTARAFCFQQRVCRL